MRSALVKVFGMLSSLCLEIEVNELSLIIIGRYFWVDVKTYTNLKPMLFSLLKC